MQNHYRKPWLMQPRPDLWHVFSAIEGQPFTSGTTYPFRKALGLARHLRADQGNYCFIVPAAFERWETTPQAQKWARENS